MRSAALKREIAKNGIEKAFYNAARYTDRRYEAGNALVDVRRPVRGGFINGI